MWSNLLMEMAEEAPLTIDEIARKLKCARGWVQLTVDAGCPMDGEGRVGIREFMMFQLKNIHLIRELAGLDPIESTPDDLLKPNVKAILTTQLEWLQFRSPRESVQKAAKLVCDKLQTIDGL